MNYGSRPNIAGNSTSTKRVRRLTAGGELFVLRPTVRIQELRQAGRHIVTRHSGLEDAQRYSRPRLATYLGGRP